MKLFNVTECQQNGGKAIRRDGREVFVVAWECPFQTNFPLTVRCFNPNVIPYSVTEEGKVFKFIESDGDLFLDL